MPAPRDTSRLTPAEHLKGILAAGRLAEIGGVPG